jgi:hypothetical protein
MFASKYKKLKAFDQTKPNQTKPNQTKPNQTKPNQTKPNQTKPNLHQPDSGLVVVTISLEFLAFDETS